MATLLEVAELIHLLELADQEGGDETGPSLSERLSIAKKLLATQHRRHQK